MERRSQLDLCAICTKSIYSLKKGVVCGLTNDIADFDYYCPEYVLDEKRLGELKAEVPHILYSHQGFSNSYDHIDKFRAYKNTKPPKTQLLLPRKTSTTFILIVMTITILYAHITSDPQNHWFLLSLGLPILSFILFYRETKNNTVQVEFMERGIKFEDGFISWHHILDTYLYTSAKSNSQRHHLAFVTMDRKVKTYSIGNLEYDYQDVIHCFKHYQNKYKTNF